MKIAIAFLLLSLNCCFTLPVDKKDEPAAPVPKPIVKPEPKVPETEPKPVPKEHESVPKPVPKEPQPVPKKEQPVPKKEQPVPQKPEPVPKQQQPVPQKPKPAPKPAPKIDCLVQLLKKDAPALLKNLGTLLCNYRVAQKQQNVAYFISFLEQVDNILKGVGCTLSNLLGTTVTINTQDAASLANEVSLILFGFLEDIIERVVKILTFGIVAYKRSNVQKDFIWCVGVEDTPTGEIPILRDFINDAPLTEDVRSLACSVLDHYLTKIANILIVIADITGGLTQIIEGL